MKKEEKGWNNPPSSKGGLNMIKGGEKSCKNCTYFAIIVGTLKEHELCEAMDVELFDNDYCPCKHWREVRR